MFSLLLGLGCNHQCKVRDTRGDESRTGSRPERSVRRIRSLPKTPEPEVDLSLGRMKVSHRMSKLGTSRGRHAGPGRANEHRRKSSKKPPTNFTPKNIWKVTGDHIIRHKKILLLLMV